MNDSRRAEAARPTDVPEPQIRFHPSQTGAGGVPALHAERLYELIGREHDLGEMTRALRHYAQGEAAPVVGALHVSCSDEAQDESLATFQRDFVHYVLPSHTFSRKGAMHTSNLGGRYEWGAVRIAEDHFALARGAEHWKLMVIKIDAHVAAAAGERGASYGRGLRYGKESIYCGALDQLLTGPALPATRDLEEVFEFEGHERLAALRDPGRVAPALAPLYAAVVNARLQARRAVMDAQDYAPNGPTLYLVLPCVTLNRSGHDTELLCGIYTLDRRAGVPHDEYCGLGDRPAAYRASWVGDRVTLDDDGRDRPRVARDHRSLVLARYHEHPGGVPAEALQGALGDALDGRHHRDHPYARAALITTLGILSEVAPVPAALLLFGQGWIQIHHAIRAHRLARENPDADLARGLLREVQSRVDELDPEEARRLVDLLAGEVRRPAAP